MKLVIAIFTFAMATIAFGQTIFGDENAAYVLTPARVVSDSFVTYASFSNDGKRLVFSRINPSLALEPEKATAEWFVYDLPTSRTYPIRLKGLSTASDISILGDGKNLFIRDASVPTLNGFYNLESGRFQACFVKSESVIWAGLHPQAPFMIVEGENDTVGVVYPFGTPWFFKPSKSWSITAPFYSDSQVIKILCASEGRPVRFSVCTVVKSNGSVTYAQTSQAEAEKLFGYSDPSSFELRYQDSSWRVHIEPDYNGKPKKPFTKLDEWAYVCGDKATNVIYEWESDVVAYCDAGVLLLRELKKVDHNRALDLTLELRHRATMNAAKQVGIALLIYAADADDILPNGENFIAKLLPYTKDSKILSNFNYTFAGGPIDKIKDPAGTELGFVLGEGGRAIVYADGHAKWVSDKP